MMQRFDAADAASAKRRDVVLAIRYLDVARSTADAAMAAGLAADHHCFERYLAGGTCALVAGAKPATPRREAADQPLGWP